MDVKEKYRLIKRAIYNNSWLAIEYKNKQERITKYMIGIKDIDTHNFRLKVDAYNHAISQEIIELNLYFESIIEMREVSLCYYDTPKTLIEKIEENLEVFSVFNDNVNVNHVLDYFLDSFKLDTTPFCSEYELIKGVDNDIIKSNEVYKLSDEQINLFFSNYDTSQKNFVKKLEKKELVLNILSIKNDKGLYVLAYKPIKFDIKKKCLHTNNEIYINKQFNYNEKNGVIQTASYSNFVPEDAFILFENIEKNLNQIVEIMHEYNNTRNSSYSSEIKIDTNPFIITLVRTPTIDLESQYKGIREMLSSKEGLSKPIGNFFGVVHTKKSLNKDPVFVIDEQYNIDQLNAVYKATKYNATYIQGPPGTGKTKTLLNAIVTMLLNNKTALVTSNNNTPIDGVFEDILKLKYKNSQLLFPAIRLGNNEQIKNSLIRIKKMIETASKLKVLEKRLKSLIDERKGSLKELEKNLSDYDERVYLTDQLTRAKQLVNNKEYLTDETLKFRLDAEVTTLTNKLNSLETVDEAKIKSIVKNDEDNFFMVIHFLTVQKLQELKKSKYEELNLILNMDSSTEELANKQVIELKNYLRDNVNLKNFLNIFPIVLSTNQSCTYLGDPKPQFDIVMMDEAGQCNVATALIPIIRSSKIMLIGDPQQLRPVILLDSKINDKLKSKYNISDSYDYIKNSIYTTYTSIDISNVETFLSYHYRCHKDIITFSNQKYYNDQLKVYSKSDNTEPLLLIDSSEAFRNDLKNTSTYEVDYAINYAKQHLNEEIAIITPFVRQKQFLEQAIKRNNLNNVVVGTVHTFQGEQKDTVLFSTAITNSTASGTYDWLKNNRELINVAISRAKSRFVLLGNYKKVAELSKDEDDISDLFKYVSKKGNWKVKNVSNSSQALGTKFMSTASEVEFQKTINQALSVLTYNTFVKEEVSVKSIFQNDHNSIHYFTTNFDLVLFEKNYDNDKVVGIFELDGPEHLTDEDLIRRDKYKDDICKKAGIKLFRIRRDCARDYHTIKRLLISLLANK